MNINTFCHENMRGGPWDIISQTPAIMRMHDGGELPAHCNHIMHREPREARGQRQTRMLLEAYLRGKRGV